jgi:hypothetical protein
MKMATFKMLAYKNDLKQEFYDENGDLTYTVKSNGLRNNRIFDKHGNQL